MASIAEKVMGEDEPPRQVTPRGVDCGHGAGRIERYDAR
jgi:hypothetical protein